MWQNEAMMKDLNSRKTWNFVFQELWEANHGEAQTAFFTHIFLAHLPAVFHTFIRQGKLSFLDWGCALGNALPILAEAFPDSNLMGMDHAEVAIHKARKKFPQFAFSHQTLAELKRKHQVIYTSNCLEHFKDPLKTVQEELLPWVEDYLMILVPFKELHLDFGHLHRFDEQSFPASITLPTQIFRLCYIQAIDTASLPNTHWKGLQVLLIYGHQNAYGLSELIKNI